MMTYNTSLNNGKRVYSDVYIGGIYKRGPLLNCDIMKINYIYYTNPVFK